MFIGYNWKVAFNCRLLAVNSSCEKLVKEKQHEQFRGISLSHGYEIINWLYVPLGSKLSRKTVVHNWQTPLDHYAQRPYYKRDRLACDCYVHVCNAAGYGVVLLKGVVENGLRCIVSNQDKWYLDHLDALWPGFYMNDPLTNITDPKQQALVLGGEVCMWGEHIDVSDIEQTIWPRAAAAAAERLWTPYNKIAKDPRQVVGRLAHFRCLLNQRGVAAAPLAGPGRVAPEEPGFCYKQ